MSLSSLWSLRVIESMESGSLWSLGDSMHSPDSQDSKDSSDSLNSFNTALPVSDDLIIIPGKVKANRVRKAVYPYPATVVPMQINDLCCKELNLNLLLCIIPLLLHPAKKRGTNEKNINLYIIAAAWSANQRF